MGKVISEFLLGAGENRGEVIAHKQYFLGVLNLRKQQ
jgi:hypothetical protein